MAQYKISDAGDARKYFTIIPNMIDDADLSVYAFRLYVHIKRVAGENGNCHQNIKTLADACRMSQGMVTKARRELAEKNLITIERVENPHGGYDYMHIRIADLWKENASSYSEPASSQSDTSGSLYEPTGSPRVIKEEPLEEEPFKKNKRNEGGGGVKQKPQTPPPPTYYPDDYSEALDLYTKTTGMTAFPGSSPNKWVPRLGAIARKFGGALQALPECQRLYQKSLKCKTKDGRFYFKTNDAWVDWVLSGDEPLDASEVDPMAAVYAMYPRFSASDPR